MKTTYVTLSGVKSNLRAIHIYASAPWPSKSNISAGKLITMKSNKLFCVVQTNRIVHQTGTFKNFLIMGGSVKINLTQARDF